MSRPLLAVIDGNSLLHRAFHGVQLTMTAPDGTPTNAVYGFMQMLLRLIEDFEPDAIVCAWDSHRPKWRLDLLPDYKGQRPPLDPLLAAQFPVAREILDAMNIPSVALEGYEGDDILGTFAAIGAREGWETYLITGDKDAYQLVSEHVSVVTTKRGMSDVAIYTPDAVAERYQVTPEQFVDYLGLMGDSSDNIPGVPGVGPKKAAALLGEFGSMEGVLAAADGIKGKLGENIRSNMEEARVSREVARIRCDAPVDLDLAALHFPQFEAAAVKDVFGRLRFVRHLDAGLALIDEEPAAPAPAFEIEAAASAAALVEEALAAGEWVAAALEEPEEMTLFAPEPHLAFAARGKVASAEISEGLALLQRVAATGRLVAFDFKALVRACAAAPLRPQELFDISLAAYLLNSTHTPYTFEEVVAEYTQLTCPDGIPAGQFEAAAALALREPLAAALREDGSWECYQQIEIPLVPVLTQMECAGVEIDANFLRQMSAQLGETIDALREEAFQLAGHEFNLDSPKQLGEVLFEELGLNTKKSKKTQRGWSTNAAVLEKLSEDHPLPGKIIEYRELTKLRNTYLDTLPNMCSPTDGRVHTIFNQNVTATGRLSSSEPNLQNIPVRTELGRRIREAFIAPAGEHFVSADYSQIELRVLAHLSGDEHLIAAFNSGEDFHAATAARVFGVPASQVTSEMRRQAKAVNFGIVYGQQAFGLAGNLGISMKAAQEMIDRYFAAYPQVREYLDQTVEDARQAGHATTMFGRKRRIPDLHARGPQRAFAERTAMNHPIQGTAADIIKLAMIQVAEKLEEAGLDARMVLQVHDELCFECPAAQVEQLKALVATTMQQAVALKVPLLADVAFGSNWSEAH